MNTVPFSLRRVGLIAGVTLREALRQKLLHALVLIAAGLVLGVRGLRDFNFGISELKFIADFGDGAIAGFGAALTIALTAQLFFSEIEHRTALTLLAKPVWRTEFLLGKFLGVAVVAVAFCGLLTATLVGVLGQRQLALQVDQPEAWAAAHAVNFGALWVSAYLHALKLALLAAGTLLVASFAQTQIFAVMAGGAGFVICHLQGLAQAAFPFLVGAFAGALDFRAQQRGNLFERLQRIDDIDRHRLGERQLQHEGTHHHQIMRFHEGGKGRIGFVVDQLEFARIDFFP